MNSILKILNNISDQIKKIENSDSINYGGCCYFAYLIAKQLKKRNIPYLTVLDTYSSKKTLNDRANNRIKIGNGCAHVLIKVGNKYYDSSGFDSFNRPTYETIKYLMWEPKLIMGFYKNNTWNPTFKNDISNYKMKKIKGIINNEFKKYDDA